MSGLGRIADYPTLRRELVLEPRQEVSSLDGMDKDIAVTRRARPIRPRPALDNLLGGTRLNAVDVFLPPNFSRNVIDADPGALNGHQALKRVHGLVGDLKQLSAEAVLLHGAELRSHHIGAKGLDDILSTPTLDRARNG